LTLKTGIFPDSINPPPGNIESLLNSLNLNQANINCYKNEINFS